MLGQSVASENVVFYIPMPTGRHLLVLQFSTPNVTVFDAMCPVFDAGATTVEWVW